MINFGSNQFNSSLLISIQPNPTHIHCVILVVLQLSHIDNENAPRLLVLYSWHGRMLCHTKIPSASATQTASAQNGYRYNLYHTTQIRTESWDHERVIQIKLLEVGYDEFKDRDGFIWTHLIGSFWSIYIYGLTCTHLETWSQPDSFIFIYIYIYWLELTWTDIHLDSWTHTWTHHNSFTIITHPIYIKQTQLTIYNYHHDSQIEN